MNMNAKRRIEPVIKIKMSVFIWVENGSGRIIPLTPRIKNMLKMFEPTIFPMAMPECLL